MSSAVEQTVKALVEFERELDQAKAEASDSVKKIMKNAADWAESAKSIGMSKAQQIASETIAKAKAEAEADAETIRKKGESSLKSFEASISKRKPIAVEAVVARLLGESQ